MLDTRTKQVYIDKAKDAVVEALEVLFPMTPAVCGKGWKRLAVLRVLWVYRLRVTHLMTSTLGP